MNVQPQFGSDEERAARRLIEQAGTILKGLRGDMPESFPPLLFAGASPEDLVRYEPRELADLAEQAWLFLGQRKLGTPKIRFESRAGPIGAERVKSVVDHRDHQHRHAVPARLGDGRIDRAGARRPPRAASDLHGGARPHRRADRLPRRRPGGRRRAARELHPHPCRAHRGRGAPERDRQGDRRGAGGRAPVRAGLAADARARRRADRRDQEQSAAASGRRDRRGDPVPRMAGRQQLHLPGRARIRADRRRARHGGARGERPRHPARARDARAAPRRRAGRDDARDHGVPERAEGADHHQGERALARAPARAHGLHRGEALRRRRPSDRRIPHRRAVHLHGLYASRPARSRICGARSTR